MFFLVSTYDTRMEMPRVWRMPLLLRAAVSVSILLVVLSQTSTEALLRRAQSGALVPLGCAVLLVMVTAVLVVLRWRLLLAWLGIALPLRLGMRAVLVGLFGGQLLPSTVGSDVVRGWVIARYTGSIRRTAASVIADRLVALFAACLLLPFTYPSLGGIPMDLGAFLPPVAVLASGGVLLAFVFAATGMLKRVLQTGGGTLSVFSRIDGVKLQAQPIVAAILVAVAIHAIVIVAAAVIASAYGVEASLRTWLSIIPVSIIASAIPVSVNGWGVREAVVVALAAQHGIPEADALVVALTIGLLNIVASLPGAYLLVSHGGYSTP
jgi:uncharacterized protein (TIRG00374 family)